MVSINIPLENLYVGDDEEIIKGDPPPYNTVQQTLQGDGNIINSNGSSIPSSINSTGKKAVQPSVPSGTDSTSNQYDCAQETLPELKNYIDGIVAMLSDKYGFNEFMTIKMKQEKLVDFIPAEYIAEIIKYKDRLESIIKKNKEYIPGITTELTTEYETFRGYKREWESQKLTEDELVKINDLLKEAKILNEERDNKDDDNKYAASVIGSLIANQQKIRNIGKLYCSVERASTLLQNEQAKSSGQPNVGATTADSFLLRFIGDKAFVSTFYLGKQKDGKTSVHLKWPIGKTERTTNFYYFFTTNVSGFDNSQSKSIVYDGNELIKISDDSRISITGFINGLFKESIALREPVQYNISEYNNTFLFDRSY